MWILSAWENFQTKYLTETGEKLERRRRILSMAK
jgi:hypothetical protein